VVVEGLTKAYGATQALDGVSFTVGSGDVHALLGGNGSGKSTAIKILAGVVPADGGKLRVADKEVNARNLTPTSARAFGLRFVHQRPAIFPLLSVAENIALGFEYPRDRFGRIQWRTVRRRAEEALLRFGLDLDVTQPTSAVRPATQAMIAIVRALQDLDELHRAVLVLDEPTAALPREEASILLRAIEGYASKGLGVLFVTHRLEEVLEVATSATVLKDGRVSVVLQKGDISHDRLVEGIVGATINRSAVPERRSAAKGPPRLSVRSLSGDRLSDVTFDVGEGEIVGVAGLLGSGRSRLLRTLFGITPYSGGEVKLDGKSVSFSDSKAAINAGVAYVPEDRARDALFQKMSVLENISMVTTGEYWRGGWTRGREERRDANELMQRFDIKAQGTAAAIGSLSGGNQQKVVLARWIRRPIKLLLLDEPTQGVDVGARTELFASISRAAAEGTAVLMVTSEFEELSLICSRVLVIRQGRMVDEIVDPSSDVLELEQAVQQE
jgi:ribose transport system ATP-binding protein